MAKQTKENGASNWVLCIVAKSCPFCDHTPFVTHHPTAKNPREKVIGCLNLDCEAKPRVIGGSLKHALARWDRRAPEDRMRKAQEKKAFIAARRDRYLIGTTFQP